MRVLVTGAGGFVGRHLVENLETNGHEVVPTSLHSGFILDVTDLAAVEACLDAHQPDAMVHLAAKASVTRSWNDPGEVYRVNVVGAANVVHALQQHPNVSILLTGSGHQYAPATHPLLENDPVVATSPYAASKIAAEQMGMLYHRQFGVKVIVSRSFNHLGPGHPTEYAVGSFCSQIVEIERGRRDKRIRVGNLETRRDLVDVRDVADAYRLLIQSGSPGEIYNVCSGKSIQIGEVLDRLLEITQLSGKVEVERERGVRSADAPVLVGDPSKIRAKVGWEPSIPLDQSLADTLDWYRQYASGGTE